MAKALALVPLLALAACAQLQSMMPGQESAADPAAAKKADRPKPKAAPAPDAEAERRIARLELLLWERDAVIDDLQGQLESARQEVVRAMAKLQTLATRAEAASAMAEADVALQAMRAGGRESAVPKQAARLMQQSTGEFRQQNYGGALYLANQAKALMMAHAPKLDGAERGGQRSGETAFAAPVKLRAGSRANVREGPGMQHAVLFSTDAGDDLTGLGYLGDWVRVMDGSSRTGWIARSLVGRRGDADR